MNLTTIIQFLIGAIVIFAVIYYIYQMLKNRLDKEKKAN